MTFKIRSPEAALSTPDRVVLGDPKAGDRFKLTDRSLNSLRLAGVPAAVLDKISRLRSKEFANAVAFEDALRIACSPDQALVDRYKKLLLLYPRLPGGTGTAPVAPLQDQVVEVAALPAGYVPWAINQEGQVVYAQGFGNEAVGPQHQNVPRSPGLRPYDREVSRERRRLCETNLAELILDHPEFTYPAVPLVSQQIKNYTDKLLDEKLAQELFGVKKLKALGEQKQDVGKAAEKAVTDGVAKWLYSKTAFGRVLETSSDNLLFDVKGLLAKMVAEEKGLPLEQIMNLHYAASEIIRAVDGSHMTAYNDLKKKVEPPDLFAEDKRGRKENKKVTPVAIKGVASSPQEELKEDPRAYSRERGIDRWSRDPRFVSIPVSGPGFPTFEAMRARLKQELVEAKAIEDKDEVIVTKYYLELDARNLVFGAGPSGSTGTLIRIALVLGRLKEGSEEMKQYVLAIIGYLGGGGAHTYHEIMTVANRALNIPYAADTIANPGMLGKELSQQFSWFPSTFRNSLEFKLWAERYYDIVYLGGFHFGSAQAVNQGTLRDQVRQGKFQEVENLLKNRIQEKKE